MPTELCWPPLYASFPLLLLRLLCPSAETPGACGVTAWLILPIVGRKCRSGNPGRQVRRLDFRLLDHLNRITRVPCRRSRRFSMLVRQLISFPVCSKVSMDPSPMRIIPMSSRPLWDGSHSIKGTRSSVWLNMITAMPLSPVHFLSAQCHELPYNP